MKIAIVLAFLFFLGCASSEKKLGEKVDQVGLRLQHLSNYKELNCEVKVNFAEPTKSAWFKQLPKNNRYSPPGGGAKLFETLSQIHFDWQVTPYRCRLNTRRSGDLPQDVKVVLADTEKKLDLVLCVWMQSFYADSPLRGWRKSEKTLELEKLPEGIKIVKGYQRALEVHRDGELVVARMGGDESSLSGHYQLLAEKLYPMVIEQRNTRQLNRLQDFVYTLQGAREIPMSFWLNLSNENKEPSSYMQIETQNCEVK